jgi:glycosyltransferase involved in cell wall biosynthesis
MRVLHVITRLIIGGAQENTVATVLGLRQKPGLEVELLSGPTHGPEGSLVAKIQHRLTEIPDLVRPVHPLKDFRALRQLEQIFHDRRPDLVHTHSGKAGFLGRLAAHRAGVPLIVHHIHGPSFGEFQNPLANLAFRAAERHAGKITTHFLTSAHAMARRYLAAGIGQPENYTRVFSGFDLAPYTAAENSPALRARYGLAPDDLVVGKIARLFPLKGHADLLTLAPTVVRQNPRVKFLLVGDGILREPLTRRVRELGLEKNFIFTGLVPPAEVAAHVGLMDLLVHLSYREALSRALPQALAAAKPVLAYDFDGADEICLDGQTGFLVQTGDTATAAQRLLQLAADAKLRRRFGLAGQQFVRENFPVQKLVDDQYALYLRLAARHSRHGC